MMDKIHSLIHKCDDFCDKWGLKVARILMGAVFIIFGVSKLLNFADTASKIGAMGWPVPALFLALAIVVEVGAGVALIANKYVRHAVRALALFIVIVTLTFHMGWKADAGQFVMFLKNLAMLAGLLAIGYASKEECKMCKVNAPAEHEEQDM